MAKLTKRAVEAAQPRDKPHFIWCDGLKGFGVRVYPSGAKAFYVDFTVVDTGKRNRLKLGDFGVLTVEQARQMAADMRHDVVKGADPLKAKQDRKVELTVANLIGLYMDAAESGAITGRGGRPKKANSLKIESGRLGAHVIPLIGQKRLPDLTRADIVKFMDAVTLGETSRTEKTGLRGVRKITGGPGTATRTLALLSGAFTYAVDRGLMASNPATGVKGHKGEKRQSLMTDRAYRQLGKILMRDDVHPMGRNVVLMLAYTGARRGEICHLKWKEVSFPDRQLSYADTKTGPSVRPLPFHALTVLQNIPRTDSPFVFPSERDPGRSHGGLPKILERIFEASGIPGLVAGHLRHGLASVAAGLDYRTEIIGIMLGHKTNSITEYYVSRKPERLVEVATQVAREVDRLMGTKFADFGEDV